MRYLYSLLFLLCICLLFLYAKKGANNGELPIFLKEDIIAKKHQTFITVAIKSPVKPNGQQIDDLKKDYANIWAHLNNLYATNDAVAGKEYYTEDWFKQICKQKNNLAKASITRSDIAHQIVVNNWSTDGLVCTLTDSAKIVYTLSEMKSDTTIVVLNTVLLYEGDHWRIDAVSIEK